ncbi:MAG: hypothetical protein MJH10_21810 [Epibacterium sp.]|nr:hypothetical protein [Epibacterium sp.]
MALFVPLAWLFSVVFGLAGIFAAMTVSNIVVGVVAAMYIERFIRSKEQCATLVRFVS